MTAIPSPPESLHLFPIGASPVYTYFVEDKKYIFQYQKNDLSGIIIYWIDGEMSRSLLDTDNSFTIKIGSKTFRVVETGINVIKIEQTES